MVRSRLPNEQSFEPWNNRAFDLRKPFTFVTFLVNVDFKEIVLYVLLNFL